MYHNDKTILIILDGWGHGQISERSAIAQSQTPFIDSLYQQYPHAELITYGEAVGLPVGQMGNSEVGHLNIGAGRVVYQELLRINNALTNNELANNEVLLKAIAYAKQHQKKIHLMGLVSDGGVHSHIEHIKGLCSILDTHKASNTFIHAFTDGRDTSPTNGLDYIADLQDFIQDMPIQIASVIGRYYAMDRDKRWERIKLAYDLLINGKGTASTHILTNIQQSYEAGITDEFIQPIVKVNEKGQPLATIQTGDVVLVFNFRTDRCRQITQVLTQQNMPDFDMNTLDVHYVTMTRYDNNFKNVDVLFEKVNLQNTLGEVLSKAGKRQIRIAETEKYPHVTFFFSGGREAPFPNEQRILIPSPKVATYDLKPAMSAHELTQAILPEIKKQDANFICLNFANPDMVGHTGVFSAAVQAVETVDACTQQIVATALEQDYALLIIADHGNADVMLTDEGKPHTAHTTNPVPIFLIANDLPKNLQLKNGKLADVAPTILQMMKVKHFGEMTGKCLIR